MKTRSRGQALVEFALILPILLLLILGIIEGARIIWAYVQVQNAAREAARYAVTGQPYDAQGDPWSPAISDQARVAAIKQVAVGYATGLGVSAFAIADDAEYQSFASTPGAFGVRVKGQRTATDTEGEADYAGKPGLNVLVQIYYNVQMLDPIFSALLYPGWVRINAQVVMQNEGVDTTASGLAPVGLGGSYDFPGGGGAAPGDTRIPRISVVQAQPVPAGTTITILLEDHSPGTTYQVYFDDQLVGTVTTSAQFFAQIDYYIPISTTAGEHIIHSELPGTGSAVANAPITVEQPTAPAIIVDGGTRWPAGSPIMIRIFKHDPNTTYRIRFAGSPIGTITTDANGNGSYAYTIPSNQPVGTVFIESLTMDGSFSPANTSILIISPRIVVQGGTVWPAGTRIYIFLRDHAPGQTYSVYFGGTLIDAAVTANAIGEAILSYVIPSNTADGTYVIRSQQGSSTIAQLNLQVATPPTPFIVVLGGYEWPAGSPITIQLRKHSANLNYDVYFGANYVGRFNTDASGEYTIPYIIPVAQPAGVYSLRSVRTDNGNQEATVNVTVTAVPVISVDGGLIQAPGATITIRLTHHAPNAAYDVYLGGVKIGTVSTDATGGQSLTYTLPASTAPGDYTLESKPAGGTTAVASAILRVQAPDLTVVNIQAPARPVFNTGIPITITLRNLSNKAISNQYFDVDVYVDPTLQPTAGDAGLPPGVHKYWYNSVPASGTLTIYDTVTLWGPKTHRIYARADTSGNILEANEQNNILGRVVVPASCGLEISDEFQGANGTMPAGWASVFYGNAADDPADPNDTPPQVYQTNGTLFIRSEGRDTTLADDNASNAGYAFVYREGSGDFDVYVQLVSNAYSYSTNRRSGLEVRDDLGGTTAKVNLLLVGGNTVRMATRSNNNVASASPATTDPDYPIWLRLIRRGNTFSAYWAPRTVTNVPPQANDWVFLRDVSVPMDGTVYIGLVNAAQYYSTTQSRNWSSSNFDYFRYCGDPAGALTCGEVQETGGAVFIDAINYTNNIIRGGQAWTQTTRAGLAGVHVPNAGVTVDSDTLSVIKANSPRLDYQVKFSGPFTATRRYYIALLGWGPDTGGDSVHMGLNGELTTQTDDLGNFTTTSSNPPQWIRDSGWYVDIPSAGSYTLNLFMREDGAQVYKIALFTQVDYPLTGFGPQQSECTVTAPQNIPPGFTVCNQVLVNGDFEGDLRTEVYPYWVMAEQEQVGRTHVHYLSTGTSFGVIMPSSDAGTGTPKQPWMRQDFVMPDWVMTSTTAILDLRKGVDWLGAPNNEPLYFYLRTTSGITLTNPVVVATGQDFPDLDPLNYNNASWSHLSVDVVPYMLSGYSLANFVGQSLQAYFFSPNPGSNSTEFYLDKINLNICTMQPRPAAFTNRLTGKTRLGQELRPGVNLWAYKVQGSGQPGGPVVTTYSIQDSTYDFYDLSPGVYLLYAEYWLSGTRYSAQAVVTMPASGTRIQDLVLAP